MYLITMLTESVIDNFSVVQHKRAYEVGMQVGETSDAINNLLFLVSRMIECGMYILLLIINVEPVQ